MPLTSWNRQCGYSGSTVGAKNRIARVGQELTVQEIPGDHPVFGRGLEEGCGENAQTLPGTCEVPSTLDYRVLRLAAPLPFCRYGAVAFEDRPHSERIDHEGLGLNLPIVREGVHGHPLRPQ